MRDMYPVHYRKFGARYPDQLFIDNRYQLTEFSKDAIFHNHDDGDGLPEVDSTKLYFQNYSKKILLTYIQDYYNPEGSWRRPSFAFNDLIRPWKRTHISGWQVSEAGWKESNVPDQLVVVNYGYLDKLYKYQPLQLSEYYRWKNRWKTIFKTMNDIAGQSQRHQFVIIPLPTMLQGRTMLEKFQDREDSITAVNIFGQAGMDGFFELEFWRFIGLKFRSKSLLSQIEETNFNKINIIFQGRTGKQVLVNLAYLNSWIKGQKNQTELTSLIQFDSTNIQKLFLKMCIVLNGVFTDDIADSGEIPDQKPAGSNEQQTTTTATSEEDLVTDDLENPILDTDDEHEFEVIGDDLNGSDLSGFSKAKKDVSLSDLKSVDEIEKEILANTAKLHSPTSAASEIFDTIDADLKILDRLSLERIKNRGMADKLDQDHQEEKKTDGPIVPEVSDEELAKIFEAKTPERILQEKLYENLKTGLITPTAYRKHTEQIEAFGKSADPYGSGKPRAEAKIVTKEDINISEKDSEIMVGQEVPDRTMAEARFKNYTKNYLKKVLHKDVLQVIDHLQTAGVSVRKHEVTRTKTVLGEHEHHRLEIKPFDGEASVIKFSLPVVNKDGTYNVSGSKYQLRVQRTDAPIRKIAPSIVSLSTYYGKTFVQISPKMANNSMSWIYRQLNLSIITDGSVIKDVSPGNVFDNNVKAPFIYNAIAAEYEKFSTNSYHLYFNYKERVKFIDPARLKEVEKNGRVFCGYGAEIKGRKQEIVVDTNNHFYLKTEAGDQDLGDIYKLLELPREKAPIDYAEVRVFSKYVPLAILLGFYIGWPALLKLTQAKFRTVEPRKNKQLQDWEYAIVFKNISYVFDRRDKFSSLILSGFLEFEKNTKLYDVELFEHRDIYLNLLLTKKIGSVYIREMEMMEHSFVDPISLKILQDMNEPITFKGLLVRSVELLESYDHPASQARSAMRDRGYERFAGTVYKELMRSIKNFRNSNLMGRSKIDISPYQIWNEIVSDAGIKIVEDINPIQDLKQAELVTFSGTGGRDKETMTRPTRAYMEDSVGVDSEATVDSAAVGTVMYLSANPNITDVYGRMTEQKKLNPTSIMSTSALLSPCSFMDNKCVRLA